MVAVAIVLAASFVVMALILCNVWASMFVVSIKSFLFAILFWQYVYLEERMLSLKNCK